MAETKKYQSHLSLEAVAFVTSLPRRQQHRVLDLCDRIARHPSRIGDYQLPDASGRPVDQLLIDGYLFSFWIDHAVREVRISEIVRV